jgi:hypothetical protein
VVLHAVRERADRLEGLGIGHLRQRLRDTSSAAEHEQGKKNGGNDAHQDLRAAC